MDRSSSLLSRFHQDANGWQDDEATKIAKIKGKCVAETFKRTSRNAKSKGFTIVNYEVTNSDIPVPGSECVKWHLVKGGSSFYQIDYLLFHNFASADVQVLHTDSEAPEEFIRFAKALELEQEEQTESARPKSLGERLCGWLGLTPSNNTMIALTIGIVVLVSIISSRWLSRND
jgi:hypothetical protein